MPTPICWAASVGPVEPVNDTLGNTGGASPDPDNANVRLSILNEPVVCPTVTGAKPTAKETVAPGSTFRGSAGSLGSVNTSVAGPVALMLLMKATVFPVLLIWTCAVEVAPTCVGVKITAPLTPNGVLAEPTTDVNARVVPTPTALRSNESLPILRRAVNVAACIGEKLILKLMLVPAA